MHKYELPVIQYTNDAKDMPYVYFDSRFHILHEPVFLAGALYCCKTQYLMKERLESIINRAFLRTTDERTQSGHILQVFCSAYTFLF